MARDYRICETVETMENYGASAISNSDLLAIILNNKDKADKLLKQEETLFEGTEEGIRCIAGKDLETIKYLGGLSKSEAAKIYAAIEIGKRIANLEKNDAYKITSPGSAAEYLMPRLRHETHERFLVMLRNTKNKIMSVKQIAEGSLTSAVVHPREVFAPAVTAHAACILVAHNHPSGDPYPSHEDRSLTKALADAGDILGIPVLDHVVIGDGSYYSFKEHGDL